MRKLKSASMAATVLVAGLATVASGAMPAAAAVPAGAAAPARAQGATPAPTDMSVTLPLQQFDFAGAAVDAKNHHLYFTDGTKLLVTDLAGGVVASIPLTDAGQVALAPDDGALYVATGAFGRTIVQIDTRTLTTTRSFTVDSTLNLTGLAASDDRLWYIANLASSCTDGPYLCKSGGVGSFDLHSSSAAGTFTLNPDRYAPITVPSPRRPEPRAHGPNLPHIRDVPARGTRAVGSGGGGPGRSPWPAGPTRRFRARGPDLGMVAHGGRPREQSQTAALRRAESLRREGSGWPPRRAGRGVTPQWRQRLGRLIVSPATSRSIWPGAPTRR